MDCFSQSGEHELNGGTLWGEPVPLLAIGILILLLPNVIQAEVPSSPIYHQNQIEQLALDLNVTKEKLLNSDEKSRSLLGNLYEINQKIKTMSEKRSKLNDEMLSTKGDATALAQSIAQLELKIDFQKKLLSRRIRILFKMGEQGTLQTIFSSQTAFELDRNLAFLKRIADRDYELIQNFEINMKLIKNKRLKLKKNIVRLVSMEHRLKNQESSLEREQKSKSQLLQQIRETRRNYLTQMKILRKKAGGIENNSDILPLIPESFFERKGQLEPPISHGFITQDYGLYQNGKYKFKLSHKGLLLRTGKDPLVRAIFNGSVPFAGYIEGFGKTIIIDHGDRYYSIYAHLTSLSVKKDQQVAEGTVIGKSHQDDQGMQGIYFEIRHYSDSLDPKQWLVGNWPRKE